MGINFRLDTIQVATLQVKLSAFREYELDLVKKVAKEYTARLNGIARIPVTSEGFASSWSQYTIQLENIEQRDKLQQTLKDAEIPSMIYYQKPMHRQGPFNLSIYDDECY